MSQILCPSEEQLQAYVLGKTPEELAAQIERHLEVCRDCEATAEGIETRRDSIIAAILESSSSDPYLAEPQCRAAVAKGIVAGRQLPSETQLLEPATAPPADLGRLGDYKLLAKVGGGAMGAVYKAEHTLLKRVVALKVLPEDRLTDQRLAARLQREMEAVGQLDHPNVVTAHDARDIDGQKVLAMEFIEGMDIARIVECVETLAIADACELVRQTAIGLQYAQQRGLIHRDVKPSNLMLTLVDSATSAGSGKEGRVKILDFGLALLKSPQPDGDELTAPGTFLGTVDFMAPEQASDARSVDIRADIYSMGCTLYKLLTGCAPFSGPRYKTVAEKIVGHLKDTPRPLQEMRADVPGDLATLIARMMAKSPDERFATPGEVARVLARFAVGCDLSRLLTDATAKTVCEIAKHQVQSVTSPIVSSAFVDTDAGGLVKKGEQPLEKPTRRSLRRWWIATGAAALFALAACGILITIKITIKVDPINENGGESQPTREGVLVVHMDNPRAKAQVLNAAGEVVIERPGAEGELKIGVASGKGRLRIVIDGVEVFGDSFSVEPGGTVDINAKLPPPPAKARPTREQLQQAERLGVPVETTNSIGMKLVLIPSGEFLMGSIKPTIDAVEQQMKLDNYPGLPWYRARLPSELPQHRVRITKPYRLGLTEVTQEQYRRVMGANPSEFHDDSLRPVECVSWNDCAEFCRRLSELPEEKAAGRCYALPTEAQWEYACWTGSPVPVPSAADTAARAKEDLALGEVAWYGPNAGGCAHPVGQKRPNRFGLYDMYGNVLEWCADWYAADYYAHSPMDDPAGPASGSDRVQRGGSWFRPSYACRAACRDFFPPETKGHDMGFRVLQIDGISGKQRQEDCAKQLRVPVEFTNSIGMKLVLIPSGEFLMGSTQAAIDAVEQQMRLDNYPGLPYYRARLPSESPQHRVRITKPYRLGATEVTQAQYQRVMGENPSEVKGDSRPVESVSWNECAEFCRRLSELPEEKAAKRHYALPTEAQWEYACWTGNPPPLPPTNDSLARAKEDLALGEVAWYGPNSGGRPHPVGRKRANVYGLDDMYGNVTEWCADWYAADYYAESTVDDPAGPASGTERVVRGGSWFNPAYACRPTSRAFESPEIKDHTLGFRVMQNLVEQ
jgi:formylglycine-generating enzyme required for sulfatase activity/serine/threonine protein kinase